ncbi:phosphatase PAP2 family protein [Streptomyces sp. NPDC087300]|uniref:phosphatase PAP2 family protein n=1 Tax=Streptomyces sp. NPDC087300 TaxID=3365780 RepID=UPI003815109F
MPSSESVREPAAVPRPSGRLALGAVLLLLVPVAVGLFIRPDVTRPPFQGLDDTWLRWMGGPHDGALRIVADALNWFGGPAGSLVPLLAIVALCVLRRWRSALFVLFSVLATQLVVQSLKHLVDRPRPEHPLITVDHGSFPSGHAATMAMTVIVAGALFVPAAARRRWWWPVGVLLVLTMMWSRTWLHAHWLSDTAAGAFASAGVTLLVWSACAVWMERDRGRGGAPAFAPDGLRANGSTAASTAPNTSEPVGEGATR